MSLTKCLADLLIALVEHVAGASALALLLLLGLLLLLLLGLVILVLLLGCSRCVLSQLCLMESLKRSLLLVRQRLPHLAHLLVGRRTIRAWVGEAKGCLDLGVRLPNLVSRARTNASLLGRLGLGGRHRGRRLDLCGTALKESYQTGNLLRHQLNRWLVSLTIRRQGRLKGSRELLRVSVNGRHVLGRGVDWFKIPLVIYRRETFNFILLWG